MEEGQVNFLACGREAGFFLASDRRAGFILEAEKYKTSGEKVEA